jgi:hypothetical protein
VREGLALGSKLDLSSPETVASLVRGMLDPHPVQLIVLRNSIISTSTSDANVQLMLRRMRLHLLLELELLRKMRSSSLRILHVSPVQNWSLQLVYPESFTNSPIVWRMELLCWIVWEFQS